MKGATSPLAPLSFAKPQDRRQWRGELKSDIRFECPLSIHGEGVGGRGRTRYNSCGFTLIETMVAMAVLAFALLGLLGLQHQSLLAIIHGHESTQAAMLAQTVLADAEIARYPDVGTSHGNFNGKFPGRFQDYQWQETVTQSPEFCDVHIVKVTVTRGNRTFSMTEYLHSPVPPPACQPQ